MIEKYLNLRNISVSYYIKEKFLKNSCYCSKNKE